MAYKKKKIFFFLFFLFFSKLTFGEIVYEKNNIIITNIEYEVFKKTFELTQKIDFSKNQTIKKIILIKNTINFFKDNNPDYLKFIDENIKKELNYNNLYELIDLDYRRFLKIKNEFINQYFINSFTSQDLQDSLSNLNELKLPISNNDCFTILEIIDFKDNKNFYNNFYYNLKNNLDNYIFEIKEKKYNVCLSQEKLKFIEDLIIDHISKKIDDDFNNFIYKIKN